LQHGNTGNRPTVGEPSLLIGRNSRGQWVVQDPLGKCGGLFTDRGTAFRFATRADGRPRSAVMVPGPIEFVLRGAVHA
jgi:hypothetical protein